MNWFIVIGLIFVCIGLSRNQKKSTEIHGQMRQRGYNQAIQEVRYQALHIWGCQLTETHGVTPASLVSDLINAGLRAERESVGRSKVEIPVKLPDPDADVIIFVDKDQPSEVK